VGGRRDGQEFGNALHDAKRRDFGVSEIDKADIEPLSADFGQISISVTPTG
jgi:hypothetical protein